MKIKFTKMQGAGNDFVMLDGVHQHIDLNDAQLRWLADRHFGIGADQVLIVERPNTVHADFKYRVFNADGVEVEQCGNGARCFARFVHAVGLTQKTCIRVEVQKGLLILRVQENGEVSVDMGPPIFEPTHLSFDTVGLQSHTIGVDTLWLLPVNNKDLWISAISTGNPHAVQTVDEVDCASVCIDGAAIESHPRFAERVNVGFMQIISQTEIKLRVYERGVGETLACGSGACAAALTAIRRGFAYSPVTVRMRGGVLKVAWNGEHVHLSGPAVTVFEGEISVPSKFSSTR